MDKLLAMEVFTQVAVLGSFTKAAEEFAITPTMVGKHIKQLEQKLGVTLIRRTTRRQTLTEVGKIYLDECQQVLQNILQLEQKIAATKNSPSGKIKINAPVTLGNTFLSSIISTFLRQFPELEVELILDDGFVDAMHDDYDFIFRIGKLNNSSLIARKVLDYAMVICASAQYLAKNGTPKAISELNQHACLGFTHWKTHGSVTQKMSTNAFDNNRSRFRSNSGQVLKTAALNHSGILLQPRMLVEEELKTGKLIEILQDFTPENRPVNLLYKSRKNQPYKNKLFVDFLVNQFKSPNN